jgi:anti-sigma regulatory factor (Ser/Thr protein kinase)
MRRNNENLLVLSGGEVARRSQRPTALADLLRASVSEIEQYQRVVLLPPPSVEVVGYAVGDLVRLVAELLDNATAFSAPDTQVTIASHVFDDGSLCVAVHDEGIGMNSDELDEANAKLADGGLVDVSTSRRMGLFVVGRLAGRHGIEVRLNGGHDMVGIRATVTVPSDVIIVSETPRAEPERPRRERNGTSLLVPFSLSGQANGVPAGNGHTNGVIRSGLTPSPLPRADREYPDDGEHDNSRLPRRSPGGRMPGPKPSRGLFTPVQDAQNTGWWTDKSSVEETTPIFDEMASAWFRTVADPPAPTTEPQPPSQDDHRGDAWNFAADSGFDAARAVSKAEPSDFTSGGLPRRSPRQNLVPGSAHGGTVSGEPRHERDADVVRNRLSEYRQGVRRARDHRHGVEPPTPSTAPVTPSRPSTSDTQQLDMNGTGWRFAADIGWQAATQASSSAPVDFTSGGLPRRSPRQNLVPGSVSHSGHGNGGVAPRAVRAEEMRGRLGNFQKGLSRGRRSLADRSAVNGVDRIQQQESE